MKTLTRSLMLAALFICTSMLAYSDVITEFTIGDGGTLKWNGKMGKDCKCDPAGDNCKIKITMSINVVDDPVALHVMGNALTGEYNILMPLLTVPFEEVFNYDISGATFEILDGQFPGVPPQIVTVPPGVITGPDGFFAFNIMH